MPSSDGPNRPLRCRCTSRSNPPSRASHVASVPEARRSERAKTNMGNMHTDVSLDPAGVSAPMLIDAARVAEDVGFDGVWLYDHMSGVALGQDSIHDPWPLLGAIATATSTVMVGPLVANVTVRRPVHVANAAATLQELSGGRVLLGIGAGAGPGDPFARELTMIGENPKPATKRRAEVIDAIAIMRTTWSGGGSYEGTTKRLVAALGFGSAEPAPPVIVGANGPKMCAIAGAHGDGVNLHSHEDNLANLISIVRSAAAPRTPIITVEAPMESSWISGRGRERLAELRVDRLVLRWHGAIDPIEQLVVTGTQLAR